MCAALLFAHCKTYIVWRRRLLPDRYVGTNGQWRCDTTRRAEPRVLSALAGRLASALDHQYIRDRRRSVPAERIFYRASTSTRPRPRTSHPVRDPRARLRRICTVPSPPRYGDDQRMDRRWQRVERLRSTIPRPAPHGPFLSDQLTGMAYASLAGLASDYDLYPNDLMERCGSTMAAATNPERRSRFNIRRRGIGQFRWRVHAYGGSERSH